MTNDVDHTRPGAPDAVPEPLPLPSGAPEPGLYRHYKGGMYQVLGLVRHSETLEVMVLYRALYGAQGLWVRPRAMFEELLALPGGPVVRFAAVDGSVADTGAALP